MLDLDQIGLLIILLGFIIGFGAVIVIDIHGFLGRKSSYWTEATTRSHKVTKPLIWLGITLFLIGAAIFYRDNYHEPTPQIQLAIAIILIFNGLFLSFKVSPYLLEQEKRENAQKLLPQSLQNKIIISLIISDLGWLTNLYLLVVYLTQ